MNEEVFKKCKGNPKLLITLAFILRNTKYKFNHIKIEEVE